MWNEDNTLLNRRYKWSFSDGIFLEFLCSSENCEITNKRVKTLFHPLFIFLPPNSQFTQQYGNIWTQKKHTISNTPRNIESKTQPFETLLLRPYVEYVVADSFEASEDKTRGIDPSEQSGNLIRTDTSINIISLPRKTMLIADSEIWRF